MVYLCTGYMEADLYAVRVDPTTMGDVTDSHVAWTFDQGVSLKPSILLVGDEIYMVADNGIARCVDAKTGEPVWQKRLQGTFSASPVYADGRMYFCGENGKTFVIKPGREFE